MRKSTDAQIKVRLPARLKKRIDEAAEANQRSLNGEIVARLADSFTSPERSKAAVKRLLEIGTPRDKRFDDLETIVTDLVARVAKVESGKS